MPTSTAGRLFAYLLDHVARPPVAAVSAHVMYLRLLGSRGSLVVGGPYKDGHGGVVCVVAEDEQVAEGIAQADPLVVFGFALYQLHEIDSIDRLPEMVQPPAM